MSRELETTKAPESGAFMVGDTGIEPVTPTVSMLSPERWLLSLRLDLPEFLDLRRWLPRLTTVGFGCAVAPMWPERGSRSPAASPGNAAQLCRAAPSVHDAHAPIEALGCAIASRGLPSCRNRAGQAKGRGTCSRPPRNIRRSACHRSPRSVARPSLANIPSRTLLKPRRTTRDSSAPRLAGEHTLSSRAIEWPRPPEAVYLLACPGAYRAPVAICTTSVATTLATARHRHSLEKMTDPARQRRRNLRADQQFASVRRP
jgi:hypothetical protein